MASVNKVILIGNLGRDPETRSTQGGSAICNVSIATTRNWKDKASGERREETEWHRVVLFDRLAEIAQQYLAKSRPVYIEGRLKTRKWTNKDGVDQYTTEIIADQLQLLGGREDGGQRSEQPARTSQPARQQSQSRQALPPSDPFGDDDIPF